MAETNIQKLDNIMTKTLDPLAQRLIETLDPLTELYPVANWTVTAINDSFLTTKSFIDTVKIFTTIADEEVRQNLTAAAIAAAIAAGFYQSADVCTVKEMFNWYTWLKTPEGNAAIVAAQKKWQLKMSTLRAAFNEQRAEYMQAVKEVNAYYDEQLQKLRRDVQLLEEQMEMKLHSLKVDFAPSL